MKLPLRIIPWRCSIRHDISAYVIKDAEGRSININCEADPIRRDVAKLWSPEEAQALAKQIARLLTDSETQKAADDPTNGAAG